MTVAPPPRRLERPLQSFGGARAARVTDEPGAVVREHAHDWPVLSIYVQGALTNETELGTCTIDSPWVVIYGAGAAHANRVLDEGFEQIQIEFEPGWLGEPGWGGPRGTTHLIGGAGCLAGRRLAELWRRPAAGERMLAQATRRFLQSARCPPRRNKAAWIDTAASWIKDDPELGASKAAARLGLNAAWVAQAYRAAQGEGIREAGRRRRVERAFVLLRDGSLPAAEVALLAGFCDQSHMIRCFNQVLGRSPETVRREWADAKSAAGACGIIPQAGGRR